MAYFRLRMMASTSISQSGLYLSQKLWYFCISVAAADMPFITYMTQTEGGEQFGSWSEVEDTGVCGRRPLGLLYGCQSKEVSVYIMCVMDVSAPARRC